MTYLDTTTTTNEFSLHSLHSPNLLPSKDQCPDWDPTPPPPSPGLPCLPRCARAWVLYPRCWAPWPRARAAPAPGRPPGPTGRRRRRQRSSRGTNSRSFPSDIGHFDVDLMQKARSSSECQSFSNHLGGSRPNWAHPNGSSWSWRPIFRSTVKSSHSRFYRWNRCLFHCPVSEQGFS